MFLMEGYISAIRNSPYGKQARGPVADACELLRYKSHGYIDDVLLQENKKRLRRIRENAEDILDKLLQQVENETNSLVNQVLEDFPDLAAKKTAEVTLIRDDALILMELLEKYTTKDATESKDSILLQGLNFRNKRIKELTESKLCEWTIDAMTRVLEIALEWIEDLESELLDEVAREESELLDEVTRIRAEAIDHILNVLEVRLANSEAKFAWRVTQMYRKPFYTWYTYDYELTPVLLFGEDYRIVSIRQEITTEAMDWWYTYDYVIEAHEIEAGGDFRMISVRNEITVSEISEGNYKLTDSYATDTCTEISEGSFKWAFDNPAIAEHIHYGERYRMSDTKPEDGVSLISGEDYKLELENEPIASYYHESEENRMYVIRANGA